VPTCADTSAIPESVAAPRHRLSEQRQPEYRAESAHRRGDGPDRHRHHRGAGRAEGAAGPHPKPSEPCTVTMLLRGMGLGCSVSSNPLGVDPVCSVWSLVSVAQLTFQAIC